MLENPADTCVSRPVIGLVQDTKMGEDETNAILTGEASLFGQVEKLGMLPPRKWCASHPLLFPFRLAFYA